MKAFALELDNQLVRIAGSPLPDHPVISHLGRKKWRLEQPYAYRDGNHEITVPARFEFDLASIPRALWWLIGPFDLSVAAPLIHDFLYRYRGQPPDGAIEPARTYRRKEADQLFRAIMKQEGVWWWRRAAAYRAVRLVGGIAWAKGRAA